MNKKSKTKTQFIDLPELSETFADSIHALNFDGQTVRIEFCATRLDILKPPEPPTAKQYPICRLVLTPNAAIVLFNRLQQLMKVLEQSGAIKKEPIPPQTIQ